tara:strand:- start:1577 stop:1819 length:243 start_codon:yes stop_codon:yes gene_type:complete
MSVKDVVKSWDQEENIIDRQTIAMRNERSGFSCSKCVHLNDDRISCKAFPDTIPQDILANVFDHRKPFKGDNGILFEPKK